MKLFDSRREGFALPTAIVALVVVGVLVTGGFIAATQEGRISQSTRHSGEAFNLAELGLNEFLGTWRHADFGEATVAANLTWEVCQDGSTLQRPATCPPGSTVGTYSVDVQPLGNSGELFLARSTGKVTRAGAMNEPARVLGVVVRTETLDINLNQAVTLAGPLKLKGNALVDGNDRHPAGWDCSDKPLVEDSHGIVAQDSSQVEFGANGKARDKHLAGTMDQDTMIGKPGSDFEKLFEEMYYELAAQANLVFPGDVKEKTQPSLTQSGACDVGDRYNWGSPEDVSHRCASYFPVIHVQGNLELNANSVGQGILLVDKNVYVNGGFEFYGLVLTRGTIGRNGTSRITGSIFAKSGVDLDDPSEIQGNATIQFSSCAVRKAIQGSDPFSYARAIDSRGWFDLSAVGVEN
jgi:hypothetical protein